MATLINGNGNLAIYAQQDADWYAALMGGQTVITAVGNQFAYELLDANTIGVKDGVIITSEGRRIQLDANAIDSFDIPTGAQGSTNYYIIGYHLVTGNQSEQTCETFVQLMENGTDTIPEGSFRDGDDEVFVSLYRIEQDDLTIGTITLLLPQLSGSFQSQISELNNDLNNFSFRNNSGAAQYSMDDGTTWVNFKNPTGTKSITANGTYDVTDYASASVNVQQIPWLVTCSQYYTTNDENWGNLRFDKIGQSGAVGRYVVADNMTTATISGIMSLKYNSYSNVTLTPLVNMKMITVNTGGTTTGANVPTVQNLTANTPITVDYRTPFTIFIPR